MHSCFARWQVVLLLWFIASGNFSILSTETIPSALCPASRYAFFASQPPTFIYLPFAATRKQQTNLFSIYNHTFDRRATQFMFARRERAASDYVSFRKQPEDRPARSEQKTRPRLSKPSSASVWKRHVVCNVSRVCHPEFCPPVAG